MNNSSVSFWFHLSVRDLVLVKKPCIDPPDIDAIAKSM